MKLHRDLGITQKTACFMQQRIREAFAAEGPQVMFEGPVEVDETCMGGNARNLHAAKRADLTGRGGVDKTPVVGIKDRATGKVVDAVDGVTLRGFVDDRITPERTTRELFCELAKPDREGFSQVVKVEEFVGEYERLKMNNRMKKANRFQKQQQDVDEDIVIDDFSNSLEKKGKRPKRPEGKVPKALFLIKHACLGIVGATLGLSVLYILTDVVHLFPGSFSSLLYRSSGESYTDLHSPTSVEVTCSEDGKILTVSWEPVAASNSSNTTGFWVRESGNQKVIIEEVRFGTTSATVDATPGEQYSFTVASYLVEGDRTTEMVATSQQGTTTCPSPNSN